MTRRITIVLDDDLDKKIRIIQAKEITKTTKSVSFSETLNKVLRKSMK